MLSCDTMAVAAKYSRYSQNMLAKNSDRPTAEAQKLIFCPAADYVSGETVRCTDLEIPQAAHTYALIGSQPYWTWGFEMGYNEKGLMIGNEAQGSKNAAEKDTGLLGLDLLRLALERADSAREGVRVITALLERYGQNANASALKDRRYENSYLLVDPKEIWLLETAGRQWVAAQITDKLGISNCYCLGQDYDMASEGLEALAREKRWLSPGAPFHFAKAYTLPAIRQTLAIPRMRRLNKLLNQQERHDFLSLSNILRDHFEGEIIQPRFDACAANFYSICMHPICWGESETTASLLCRWDDALGVIGNWCPCQPCLSFYLPIYFTGYLPESLTNPGKFFEEASLWWKTKRLILLVSADEARFAPKVQQACAALDVRLTAWSAQEEAVATRLIAQGKTGEAHGRLNAFMDAAAREAMETVDSLYAALQQELTNLGGLYGSQKEAIETYCDYAKIPLL